MKFHMKKKASSPHPVVAARVYKSENMVAGIRGADQRHHLAANVSTNFTGKRRSFSRYSSHNIKATEFSFFFSF
jgi:hypothetical protein